MANIDHAALTGSALHEPKGVDAAAALTVYVADGGGSGDWTGPSYGSLVANDVSLNIATIGTTAQKVTVWNDTGSESGITADAVTDNDITVATSGPYRVEFHVAFKTVGAGDDGLYKFRLRVNGSVPSTPSNLGCQRTVDSAGSVGSASFVGIVSLTANDVLTVWVESDSGANTDDITVLDAGLTVHKLGF